MGMISLQSTVTLLPTSIVNAAVMLKGIYCCEQNPTGETAHGKTLKVMTEDGHTTFKFALIDIEKMSILT